MSPLRTLRQIVYPTGRHRAPRQAPERIEVPLDGLTAAPWPQDVPPPAFGAAFTQAWRDCQPCSKATAGVLHKDGWTCGECLTITSTEGAA
ncbi:hypothetical protein ACFY78_18785 [Streptomyces olindensis]|uniref:hypothetical protein n=1 Tax=Streptomyces olindensis TaxID=358823 RepID=UPI0036A9B48C